MKHNIADTGTAARLCNQMILLYNLLFACF